MTVSSLPAWCLVGAVEDFCCGALEAGVCTGCSCCSWVLGWQGFKVDHMAFPDSSCCLDPVGDIGDALHNLVQALPGVIKFLGCS